MTLFSTNPFEGLLALQRDLERAFGAPRFGLQGANSVFPPVNVFNDADGIVIRAEVPGFEPEQIDVSVESHTLVIKGERLAEKHAKPGSYHRLERQYGRFARSIALPRNLNTSAVTAECRNGLLTIRIPKTEEAKPKQIPVQKAA